MTSVLSLVQTFVFFTKLLLLLQRLQLYSISYGSHPSLNSSYSIFHLFFFLVTLFSNLNPSFKGSMYAEKAGAVKYMECSSLTGEGIGSIFEQAVRLSNMEPVQLSRLYPTFVRSGTTLLHRAARANDLQSVETLTRTMDINVRDKDGLTPLEVAIKLNNIQVARKLIAKGCDTDMLHKNSSYEGWRKRCEVWIKDEESESESVVVGNVLEFSRQITALYSDWSPPPDSQILFIGQHGTEVAKFLREVSPWIPVRTLAIANCDGSCAFDFSQLQPRLETLTLSNCDLNSTEFPESIFSMAILENLCVVKTNTAKISDRLSRLSYLRCLRISSTKIRKLPDTIGKLQKLRYFYCGRNLLEHLPDQMGSLTSLEVLDLEQNKLEKLTPALGLLNKLTTLKYSRNPLKFPTESVLGKNTDGVLEYLNSYLDNPVPNKQIKMTIVGGEKVGKTALVRAMNHNKDWRFNPIETPVKTEGIEISTLDLMDVRANVFDLAGDSTYLYTHQLFLSENSLYQAVFDMSQYAVSKGVLAHRDLVDEMGQLDFWLQTIFSQAPNSHVVVVATHADHPLLSDKIRGLVREEVERLLDKYRDKHKRVFEGECVPMCVLCEGRHLCEVSSSKFYVATEDIVPALPNHHLFPNTLLIAPTPCIPHVVGYYEISSTEQFPRTVWSSKNVSLQKLKFGLGEGAQVLLGGKVSARIPQKCLYVRDRINEMVQSDPELLPQPIMTFAKFREIAFGCGMKNDSKLKAMMDYFHTQGEFLWYSDVPELSDVVFANPQWLADHLRILFSREQEALAPGGHLDVANLRFFWPDIPKLQRLFLLEYVRRLGLSFPVSDTKDLFPGKLPLGEPNENVWPPRPESAENQITSVFSFNFLPPSFFGILMSSLSRTASSVVSKEPVYYRFHFVYSSTPMQKCDVHALLRRTASSPTRYVDHTVISPTHRVHVESLPYRNCLRVTVRGRTPCCVLTNIKAVVEAISSSRYPGVKFYDLTVCPVCDLLKVTNPAFIGYLREDLQNACGRGHELGHRTDILIGRLPQTKVPRAVCRGPPEKTEPLEDSFCPRLPVVLPVGLRSPFLQNRLVFSYLKFGHAVHFMCECPDQWHFVDYPGFPLREAQLRRFLDACGIRVCKLLRIISASQGPLDLSTTTDTCGSPSHLGPPVIAWERQQASLPRRLAALAEDMKAVLESYLERFPVLRKSIHDCSVQDDLEYVLTSRDVKRSELSQLLEVAPRGHKFGPLTCTYVREFKSMMWLCDEHMSSVARETESSSIKG